MAPEIESTRTLWCATISPGIPSVASDPIPGVSECLTTFTSRIADASTVTSTVMSPFRAGTVALYVPGVMAQAPPSAEIPQTNAVTFAISLRRIIANFIFDSYRLRAGPRLQT